MKKLITACLLIVGLINFAPLVAIVSEQKLEQVYAISLNSNDLLILMQHRALLFGLIGGFIICSAFVVKYQSAAMIMAAMSMFGFVGLAQFTGGYNDALHKVLIADYVGIAFLLVALLLKFIVRTKEID